jgi:hypothetical protein
VATGGDGSGLKNALGGGNPGLIEASTRRISVRFRFGAGARATLVGLRFSAALFARPASAYDPYDPHNCNGVDWDEKRAVIVSKVVARPSANFIKSRYDDDFTAAACPAAIESCQKKSYLAAGSLVLVGRTQGDFTCVSYQSPLAKEQIWAKGWLPRAALSPVLPMASPKMSDWIGAWRHPGGGVEIKASADSKLYVEGEMTVPTARDFHSGDFKARVTPRNGAISFADEGSYGEECQVRMQRVGPWLLVEDNSGCGGAGVTFTGLYRRKY